MFWISCNLHISSLKGKDTNILYLTLVAEKKILKGHYIVKKMASKKIYSPPVLDKIDEIEDWLRELEIWQCVTDTEEKKQGPVVNLSLLDKICKSCSDIKVSDLNKDDRLTLLITKIKCLVPECYGSFKQCKYILWEETVNTSNRSNINLWEWPNNWKPYMIALGIQLMVMIILTLSVKLCII